MIHSGAISVASKGATDTSLLRLDLVCPKNFVYQLVYLSISLQATTQAALEDWLTVGSMEQMSMLGGASFSTGYLMSQEALGGVVMEAASASFIVSYQPQNAFKGFFQPDLTSGVSRIRCRLTDNSADTTILTTGEWYAKFLQFDVEQRFHVGLNYPAQVVNVGGAL